MKKFFYIAESTEKGIFNTNLIKRFESLDAAIAFCKAAVGEWRAEGLNAFMNYDEDVRHYPEREETAQVVGCEALDEEYTVVHLYHIFETPCFMAGGSIK